MVLYLFYKVKIWPAIAGYIFETNYNFYLDLQNLTCVTKVTVAFLLMHYFCSIVIQKIYNKRITKFKFKKMDVENIIKENQGTIVDVRSYGEFMGGNVLGSINIPLDEIPQRIEELKNLKAPLILCCASGNRSGQAEHFISLHGIECYNGGSWLGVNYYKSKSN